MRVDDPVTALQWICFSANLTDRQPNCLFAGDSSDPPSLQICLSIGDFDRVSPTRNPLHIPHCVIALAFLIDAAPNPEIAEENPTLTPCLCSNHSRIPRENSETTGLIMSWCGHKWPEYLAFISEVEGGI